jgi:hypothetical protein
MLRDSALVVICLLDLVSCGGAANPGGGPGPDAATLHDSAPGSVDAPVLPVDAVIAGPDAATVACKSASFFHGDGHHHPGEDCLSGCHFHGFSVAGTLYKADKVSPASDATVTVVDANHFTQDLVVSTNGNFYAFLPVTFPVTVTASLCPSVQPMITHPSAGACNASGCHVAGGAQGVAHL